MKIFIPSLLTILCITLSFNLSSQWTLSTVNNNTGDDLQSVCFADNTTAYCTGYAGVVYKSTDVGQTWDKLTTTIPMIDMYAIAFFDADNGVVAGDLGRIYKTTDGGSSWTLKTSGTSETIYGLTILDANTIFAYGGSGIIKKSTDAGNTWSAFNSPSSLVIRQLKFLNSDPSIVFACGDNTGSTKVYKSIDSGSNWSTQSLPVSSDGDPTNLYGLSIVDAATAFTCGGSKRIAKTTDGTSWVNINSSIANFYKSCWFDSASEGYVVGANGKIIKTVNASSFTAETTGITSILYAITKSAAGTYLVVGGGGNILRKGTATANSAPVANDDASTTNFNTAVTTTVLTNDSDPDGNPLTVSIVSQSANGTAVVNGDGSITFTPTAGFSGTTTYTYQVCDNGAPSLCDQATVTITVNAGMVDNDGDGSPAGTDCDDNDNTVYPGAPELCDGKDNDCNNAIDDGLVMTTYYTDTDMDNFGTGTGTDYCSNPGAGFATVDGDCNDADAAINPAATDIPNNGIDEDCSGADATTAVDNDGDGADNSVDCDDNDNTVYPGAPELCDGKDNDCNNAIDDGLTMTTYYTDTDMDGYGTGAGTDLCANPGAGFSTSNDDCNDANATINPGATDIPNNGIDEDCVGGDATTAIDNDGDGADNSVDCDDNDNTVYPGAPELCDGKDNDCNNAIDDGLTMTTYYTDADIDNFGTGTGVALCSNPGAGFATVDGDCNDANNAINPGATDIPGNGIDEDCSGADASNADPVANDDSGTCIENGLNASISILANDSDPNGVITNSTHSVDIDIATPGVQNSFASSSPVVQWVYNSMFQTLSCDPGQDVEGLVTLTYELCNLSNSLCSQGIVNVVVAPSTASLDELTSLFSFYPNPAVDKLFLNSTEKIDHLKITGADGKVLMESSSVSTTVDVSELTTGWYQIDIQLSNGLVVRNRFMKQ